MVFQNTDPDDTDHYTESLLSTDFKAMLFGCPVEEWDIGTHSIILTLTTTLSNGEKGTTLITLVVTDSYGLSFIKVFGLVVN
jgi:hypothetical protein